MSVFLQLAETTQLPVCLQSQLWSQWTPSRISGGH